MFAKLKSALRETWEHKRHYITVLAIMAMMGGMILAAEAGRNRH